MQKKAACLLISLTTLAACATADQRTNFPPLMTATCQKLEDGTWRCVPIPQNDLAIESFRETMDYCRHLSQGYGRDALFNQRWRFWIGVAGALSGAVLAPISRGSQAAAWSAASGVTNTLQIDFDQAFAVAKEANRQAALSRVRDDFATAYANAKDSDAKYVVSVQYATKCAMAEGDADRDTLAAVVASIVAKQTQGQSAPSTTVPTGPAAPVDAKPH